MGASKPRIGWHAMASEESLPATFPAEKSWSPFAEPGAALKRQTE
jgi:hypothetical protein